MNENTTATQWEERSGEDNEQIANMDRYDFLDSSRATTFGRRDQPGRILRMPARRCRRLHSVQ